MQVLERLIVMAHWSYLGPPDCLLSHLTAILLTESSSAALLVHLILVQYVGIACNGLILLCTCYGPNGDRRTEMSRDNEARHVVELEIAKRIY